MSEKMATRQAYGEALLELGENKDIVVLDADLSKSTMTAQFAGKYPGRFLNMGISEQNMHGVAAGLALSGKTVFASTFAMFAAGRAFEIVRNSIGYTKANVKICATHAGITVGEDGGSHQMVEDIALMRTIPGMIVLSPSDGMSARMLIKEAAAWNGPVYVRLGRAAVPGIYEADSKIQIGKGMCVKDGSDYTVIATGVMVNEAMIAAEALAAEGISLRVIDMHTIKPIDKDIIIKAAKETKGIVTAEEHSVFGGLGSAVSEVAAQNCPVKMAFVGMQDTFGESGKPAELLIKYGLTADAISAAVRSL